MFALCRREERLVINGIRLNERAAESEDSLNFVNQYIRGGFFNDFIARPILKREFNAKREWYRYVQAEYNKQLQESLETPIEQDLYDRLVTNVKEITAQMDLVYAEWQESDAQNRSG